MGTSSDRAHRCRQHVDGSVILLHNAFNDHKRVVNRLAALHIHGRRDDDVHHFYHLALTGRIISSTGVTKHGGDMIDLL
jgi:hypothetical protein